MFYYENLPKEASRPVRTALRSPKSRSVTTRQDAALKSSTSEVANVSRTRWLSGLRGRRFIQIRTVPALSSEFVGETGSRALSFAVT
jgi:hypothetical protein